jgi:hypothetical protein
MKILMILLNIKCTRNLLSKFKDDIKDFFYGFRAINVSERMNVINKRFIMKSETDYRHAIYILLNFYKSVRRHG